MKNWLPKWLKEEDTDVIEETEENRAIILYNDPVSSFELVQECLMKYCGHAEEQAVQCSHIVHNNGKCDVKHGSFDKLLPIKEALQENGLTVKIE